MLTYIQVHLYLVIPPILILGAIYRPLLGRRDVIKIAWLMLMATVYTTPWDNFILSSSGWGYPPKTILFKIWHVPIEEHLFFILQPIFLILLHSIISLPQLLPFETDNLIRKVTIPERKVKDPNSIMEDPTDLGLGSGSGSGSGWPPGLDMELQSDEELGPRRNEYGRIRRRERKRRSEAERILGEEQSFGKTQVYENEEDTVVRVQTLPRRPMAALFWALVFCLGFLLVSEAHDLSIGLRYREMFGILGLGKHAFYLGWILVWISPVLLGLTWLGGSGFGTKGDRLTWTLGSAWLCFVDTYSIRSGAWFVSPETSLDWQIWRGLPVEEFLFFLLTSHLIVLSTSLITHIHTLLVLSPDLPPCPPLNPIKHVQLLARVAFEPPPIDVKTLIGLRVAEETLRKGSRSFDVAKLAFGREMRIGLVAVYAWCRVTDILIDDSPLPSNISADSTETRCEKSDEKAQRLAKNRILNRIVHHLLATYGQAPQAYLDDILDQLPDLTESDRAAFHLFSNLIPRLIPIDPFQELCHGYRTDMNFMILRPDPKDIDTLHSDTPASSSASTIIFKTPNGLSDTITTSIKTPTATSAVARKILEDGFDPDTHFPIKTVQDLNQYADNVAGSIASAICYLSWSILDTPSDPSLSLRPVEDLWWTIPIHEQNQAQTQTQTQSPMSSEDFLGLCQSSSMTIKTRYSIIVSARLMGRALQFVNIARDVLKDARVGRIYVPLSKWKSSNEVIDLLLDASRIPSPWPLASSSSSSTSTSTSSSRSHPPTSTSTHKTSETCSPYILSLLQDADELRKKSEEEMQLLPPTARGGMRAMVASYFEIGEEIKRRKGQVKIGGVKVKGRRRAVAAALAMWVGNPGY